MKKKYIFKRVCAIVCISTMLSFTACGNNNEKKTDENTASFEAGEKYADGSIKVVNLYGTWEEMGRQYGKLLESELKNVYEFTQKISNASEDNQAKTKSIVETQTNQSTYTVRQFMAGAAQTSGLTEEQLQTASAVERIAGLPKCSAIIAWDDYAKDDLVIGRNYDYSEQFKELKDEIAVTVYHPSDGALSTATIGYIGEIYAVNALNEKGIFLELNNGTPSFKEKPKEQFITGTSLLFDMMFEADSLDYTDMFFRTSLCSSSYIINMADSDSVRSYEWCLLGSKEGSDDLGDGLLVSTNHFVDPDWGFEIPVEEKSLNSSTRRNNLIQLAEENKGEIDESKMMDIMDTKYSDGGATAEYTVYQLVVEPQTRTIWLKITDASNWTKIDMSTYFDRKKN